MVNGSKSTLMSILYGLYRADAGEIHVRGQRVQINEPRDAINLRSAWFSAFMLVEPLTVAENIVLGSEIKREALPRLRPGCGGS